MPRLKPFTPPATFDSFWNQYALKRDKVAAQRAWQRLTAADRRAAIDGIAAYRDACQQRGIAMMYPQGYLNHRRWEDEAEPEAQQVQSSKLKVQSTPAAGPVPDGFAVGSAPLSPTPPPVGNAYYDPDTGMELW